MPSYVEFSDGTVDTYNRTDIVYPASNYVTVDTTTNTVKFNITQYLADNDLKFPTDQNPHNSFDVPFALEWGNLPANGT